MGSRCGYLPVGAGTVTASFYPLGEDGADQQSSGSMVETFTATGVTPPPAFQPAAGTYSLDQLATLSDTAAGAEIYYTTDGSTPVVGSSSLYVTGSYLQVYSSQTISAIAIAPGDTASSVASSAYVINVPQPDFTLALSPTSLTAGTGQTVTTAVAVGSIDGFAQSVSFACSGLPAGASCSFSPSTLASIGSSTLTITLAATTASNPDGAHFLLRRSLLL